jgi:hypothetical protein
MLDRTLKVLARLIELVSDICRVPTTLAKNIGYIDLA